MKKPAAFFFDLDGTLVDTEMPWAAAIAAALADRGAHTTPEHVLSVITGRSWFDINAALAAEFPQISGMTPDQAGEILEPYFKRVVPDPKSIVICSSVEFLKRAAEVAPCAIVSGSCRDEILKAAALCGVDGLLGFVLGAEDYPRGKPAPDCYLKAAAFAGADAGECVAVEDSAAGVRSGLDAGMRVIGLRRGRPGAVPRYFDGCEWVVEDLSELDPSAIF